ncbi:hypothetical protein GCM10010168_71700 [Actinoplanes ianthinogenes]|uniref:Transposase n=1 Tax=Actinoplanes ianthinogenes TaxID=122358 RepID=A0ABN6CPS4_9ACTN|nr:hypothetical protein Aiant_78980 [Actinoplanes ianthinogenes]GGR42524.1 hypothetical protein GCM10010168_71700 [Actinoplanes ianthinogenes]
MAALDKIAGVVDHFGVGPPRTVENTVGKFSNLMFRYRRMPPYEHTVVGKSVWPSENSAHDSRQRTPRDRSVRLIMESGMFVGFG